jgi:hypothetical protein
MTAEQPDSDLRDPRGREWLTTGKVFLVGLPVGLALTCLYVFSLEPYLMIRRASSQLPPGGPAMTSSPFIFPGLDRPPMLPAAEAQLDDEDRVIGIEVGTRSRGYHLKSMKHLMRTVINDLIEEVPVTVTYCDRTDRVRVLTAAQRGRPLRVGVGGWFEGRLVLFQEGVFYFQENGKALAPGQPGLPYEEHPFQVVTWRAWRDAHPDTDVYVHRDLPLPADFEPESLIHPRYRHLQK